MSSIPELRHDRGWSQAVLAEKSGVSRAEISAVETGRLIPSVSVALRIASAFGERVEAVFAEREARPLSWAWQPAAADDGRVWRASVNGRTLLFPVEPTAGGALPHDAWFDGSQLQPRTDISAPERTLVIAGCDPFAAFPYVQTGAYTLLNLDATYTAARNLELSVGFKNLLDDNYELAWGFPQPGRTFYIKTRMLF